MMSNLPDDAIREGEPPLIPSQRSSSTSASPIVSKRFVLVLGAIAVLAVGGGVLVLVLRDYWPESGISRYNYRRIQLGMTAREVEELIGLPPGTHRTRQPFGGITSAGNWGETIAETGVLPPLGNLRNGRNENYRQWWGTYHAIGIAVDEHEVVVGKYLIYIPW